MNPDRLQWRGHELLKELARRMDTGFLKTGELYDTPGRMSLTLTLLCGAVNEMKSPATEFG